MKVSGWQSHQPLLYYFIPKTDKPILEFGLGPWSTELIREEKQPSQQFVSLERVPEWLNKFRHLNTDTCEIKLISEYADYDENQQDWGIVFVDHRPAADRTIIIEKYADKCDYMIIHDTQLSFSHIYVGMEEALQKFKYRFDFHPEGVQARATVVSNRFELDMEDFETQYRGQTLDVEDVRRVLKAKRAQRLAAKRR